MAGYILIGTLAAVGLLCILWVCFGALLPDAAGGAFVCFGWPAEGLVSRYRWMRELGIFRGPLLIVMNDPEIREEEQLYGCAVELCSPENLVSRLEWERMHCDRTGNGDPPGRDQCRGISEL